jgi:pimeloyl-ACP methyl ester carboxylesterase
MGGKAAMVLAVSRPKLVERLVVVDIAPARSTGTLINALHAMKAVPLTAGMRRTDVEAALVDAIPDRAVRAFLVSNIRTDPDGLAWAVNLDALERHFDTILGFPNIPHDQRFTGPTLFLLGGRSEYVRPEHHAEIRRLFPAAAIEAIDGAGHWVHAEAPGPFVEAVSRFLAP